MPTVSVIIPAYNAAATLPTTLASLRSQTWTDWEAIVVDDGSTDSTAAIAQQLADPRIQVLCCANGGQAIARNRGLAVARGSLVAFLDADDWWTPAALADRVAALANHPTAIAAYSWTDYVDDRNQLLHPGFRDRHAGGVFGALLANNFIENGSNPLIRRSALDRVGGFESRWIPAEDWDLWLRLAKLGEFVLIPQAQVRYRVSAKSSSANLHRLERACCGVLEHHLTDAPPALKAIGRSAKARFYKGLACKALTAGPRDRSRGWRSARLLVLALWFDRALGREGRFLGILTVKILLTIALGPIWAARLWRRVTGDRTQHGASSHHP
ncbi:MAG: glycosyltransferase family 2 protein [Oscillatoriales cyanobacterium]|nr:MAG: glycosyltransferase family 2 protein [Oscillatoriales cyanobacterium]